MPRIAAKNWQNAYLTEARQPGGVQGAGRWTAGAINPAAAAAERNQAAVARHDAIVSAGHHRKPGRDGGGGTGPPTNAGPGDAEDRAEREQAHDLQQQAGHLETEIRQLQSEQSRIGAQITSITGSAPGSSTRRGRSNTGSVSAGNRNRGTKNPTLSHLDTRWNRLRSQIATLQVQRADLLRRAAALLRDARKNAPPSMTKGHRVAVVAQEATKAATLTDSGQLLHFSFPIDKVEDVGDGEVVVTGLATDGSLDSDLQVVDPEWSKAALKEWLDTGGNVRVQHNAQRDPAGKGIQVEGHRVSARVVEPVAVKLVKAGVLQDFSVGIMNPDIRRSNDPSVKHLDPQGKAVNGVITGRQDGMSKIGELSLVDRGSNFGTRFAMVKAAASDGTPEWVGELTAPDEVLAKVTKVAKPDTVTVELPRNMSLSVKPSDLAKLATFRQKLAVEEAATKAAAPSVAKAAEPEDEALTAIKAAEVGVYKRDIDTATRRRLASEGHALSDGSYPVENAGDLKNAAILAQSGHGDVAGAKRLIRRRAKELGVPNPLKGGKKNKAAEPEVTKCDSCAGKGMVDGKPCTSCGKGAKKAKRMAKKAEKTAAKAVRAALTPEVAKKKKVMCSSCGARQNRKHEMCSECGQHLGNAIPVMKNHAFTCLSCGKDLDKGEKHCPQCGKENPGYLPEADHQIPANQDKAAKAKKKAKGKGKKNPFGDKQAPPFGKDKDDDDDASEKAARVIKGKKGHKPTPGGAGGVPGNSEKPASRHREPDGAEVEAFETDAHMEDGDDEKATHLEAPTLKSADPEMAASLALTALGVPQHMGALHALTCPAFRLDDVAKAFPHASFAGIDLAEWQAGALTKAASAPLEEAESALAIWRGAAHLKGADAHLLADLREQAHKMFTDANPGPSHFPTPMEISPTRFSRPLITDGHQAASPGHKPPNDAKIPPVGGVNAEDYTRGYISEGHAADAPSNTHDASPMPAPDHTGVPTQGPVRQYYTNAAREGARHALEVMHDHIARNHPDICPMHGASDIARHPVPTPAGVPTQAPAGEARKAAKKAKAKARKAAKAKARKQRKAAIAKRRRLERKVLKNKMTVDEARAKLGMKPAVTKAATVEAPSPVAAAADPEAIKAAIAEANAPLLAEIAAQEKRLRRQGKALKAIASQPDTTAAPFRGVALTKQASAAPAGPLTVADSVEQATATRMRLLEHDAHYNPDPGQREASRAALMKELGVPMNPYPTMRT